jgi:hypothetical protein
MYDAVEFRKRAQHCVEQANRPCLSRADQALLLRMAAKWAELAEDADRINALIGDAWTHPGHNNSAGGTSAADECVDLANQASKPVEEDFAAPLSGGDRDHV